MQNFRNHQDSDLHEMQNFRNRQDSGTTRETRSIDAAALLDDRQFKRPRLSDPGPIHRQLPQPIFRPGLGSGFDGRHANRYSTAMPEPGTTFEQGLSGKFKHSTCKIVGHSRLADATDQYHKNVYLDVVDHLEAAKYTMLARLEGLDSDGRPIPGYISMPTEQEIAAVEAEMRGYLRPIQDDWSKFSAAAAETTSDNQAERDGHVALLHTNFSDIIANMRRQVDTKEKELRQLRRQIQSSEQELGSAIRNMLEDGDGATAEAERQLANVRRLAIGSLCETADLAIQEVKTINAEEKEAERKRQGMLRNLLNLTE